ncbi:hypothetical protein BTJ40_07535 [Microbulbifer sp. A4B17]|uniref:RHS repeat domain-containing protein n=1 Tax=Microbulbifer sp. A4B17 TaxID=359370 RepID=UPI000D52D462|nr:RHS repeat-associated core domain-containing protein [Microbulbifer sp. A4B17]AWF80678.1 hypothetical protein BTJ40_07535 [Microbulbifer sp. A4B17]
MKYTGREVYRVLSSNSRGQVTDFDINSGGVRISNGYDSATGRLLSQKADNSASATTVQQMAYGWDAVGNLVSRNNQRTGKKESFCYDNLNRLLQVNANTTSTSSCNSDATDTQYQYDSIGNILSKDGAAYLYESAKPHAVTKAAGVDYAYNDSNGNLTSDGTGRTFTYTTFDKPSLITNTQSGDSTAFTYGPDRARYQRVDTRSDGEVVTTLYLGGVERIHYQSEGSYHWKRYLPGGAVFTYETNGAYEQQSLTERYLLTDHIGSTDVVLDENGSVLESQSMAFDPWGKRRDSDWDSLEISDLIGSNYQLMDSLNEITTHGFTGHEMVDALGIIHMNGRIYDPNLGRFLQADPMIDGVEDTQGYNRYSYVKGNPLTVVDPTGYYGINDFFDDANEILDDALGGLGISFQVGVTYGATGTGVDISGGNFWSQLGTAGAAAPEGAVGGAFGDDEEDSSFLDDIAITLGPFDQSEFEGPFSPEVTKHLVGDSDSKQPDTEGSFGAFALGAVRMFMLDTLVSAHSYMTGMTPEQIGDPMGLRPSGGAQVAGAEMYEDNALIINSAMLLVPGRNALSARQLTTRTLTTVENRGAFGHKANIGLKKQLKSEEQLADIYNGGGIPTHGADSPRQLDVAERLVRMYGGNAGDWQKVSSDAYHAVDGGHVEIHAYRNIETGLVVEPKSIAFPQEKGSQ